MFIKNVSEYNIKVARILKDGVDNLHIISDFDRTLTSSKSVGRHAGSLISILRERGYLSEEYRVQAQAYADYYKPIEYDPNISIDQKKPAMMEWWIKHFELLIQSGLTLQHIEEAMEESLIELRQGAKDFLSLLAQKNIPLIIFSANGLGYDSIKYFLDKRGLEFPNIHIISNRFKFDGQGKAVGWLTPVIHTFNKDENSLAGLPFYQEIAHRKNIILLGDRDGDLGMSAGLAHTTQISFCFSEHKVEQVEQALKDDFDAVIPQDGPIDPVTAIINQL